MLLCEFLSNLFIFIYETYRIRGAFNYIKFIPLILSKIESDWEFFTIWNLKPKLEMIILPLMIFTFVFSLLWIIQNAAVILEVSVISWREWKET